MTFLVPSVQHLYSDLYHHHGYSYKSLGWSSIHAQVKRFRVIRDSYTIPGSVLDAGCGFGDLSKFFPNYTGIDIIPEFIDEAEHRHPDKNFILGDILEIDLPKFDYVFGSGILAYQPDPVRLVQRMWELTNRTLVFNWFRTTLRDIDFAIKFSNAPYYIIRNDYLEDDHTIYMMRDKS